MEFKFKDTKTNKWKDTKANKWKDYSTVIRKFYGKNYIALVLVLGFILLINFADYFFDSALLRSIFTSIISVVVFTVAPIATKALPKVLSKIKRTK